MSNKKTIFKTILGILVVTAAFVATIFLGNVLLLSLSFSSGDIPHRSDEEMIANFQFHRAEFDRMLQMINEDNGLDRVDYYWTHPENPQKVGISHERIGEYRRLFRNAGVPRGFSAFSKDYVQFIASSQGLAVSGSSKGYLFTKRPVPRIVRNLDTYRAQETKLSPAYPVYRHIEGNWYLYFKAD